jgi:hypothetical protein
MTCPKNLSIQQHQLSNYHLKTQQSTYLPGPPFEKFIHFAFHGRARDILEKVHDVVPKHFIVEVAIHGAPG